MVAWCINTLDVHARENELDAFITVSCLDDGLLQLDRVEAPPRRLRASRHLDWRQAHWGTTLDVDPDDIQFRRPGAEHATWHFHSPTTPPLAWVESVSRALPSLHVVLAYSVPDHGILGRFEAAEGRALPSGTWTRVLPSDRLLCAEPGCWLYGENLADDEGFADADTFLVEPPEVRCFRHRRSSSRADYHHSAR
jgi:hypothetical protein